MGIKSLVKQVLIEKQNRAYEKNLASKVITYDAWIRDCEQMDAEGAVREGIEKVELVYFMSPKGRPSDKMEEWCRHFFSEHSEVMLAYGDEDVWQEGETERKLPWFKPDWSPDLLDTYFYFGSVVVLRRELYKRAVQEFGPFPGEQRTAKFSESENILERAVMEFQLTPDCYQWMRQCVRLAGGYTRGGATATMNAQNGDTETKIAHIPHVIFHCKDEDAIRAYSQWKEKGSLEQEELWESETVEQPNMLSIIIPSKDNPDILENCLRGILKVRKENVATNREVTFRKEVAENPKVPDADIGRLNCEIIVVDNGSNAENKQRIESMLQQYRTESCTITYLYQPMEFHFSKMCNLGAGEATGNLLLFLNDDVELCQPGCLKRMATLAARPYTGAVGLKLYYPDSIRIQHAGITNLPMGPVHKLQFLEDDTSYYFNSNKGLRNVLAVTAACLMVEADKFLQTGGFAEELRVAFNDVDLCFQLYELGYANVCVNDSFAYHHESLSRGDDESQEKLARLLQERDTLYRRHPGLENVDPYFSAGLSRQGLDTRIRPAYETAGNLTQKVISRIKEKDLTAYRQDNCVLLRVESAVAGKLMGYGVVLGDDNSCYERELLFLPVKMMNEGEYGETSENNMVQKGNAGRRQAGQNTVQRKWGYAVLLDGQYRPELVENMPDQVNVGLSGFDLQLPPTLFSDRVMVQDVAATEYLPVGKYRIGMAVRNRVTGLRLMNVSNRVVTVGNI